MQDIVQLIAIGAVFVWIGALIASRIRQRWLVPALLIWLFAPAIPMALIFALGALFSPVTGSALYNLTFGVMLIGVIVLVPWVVAAGIGIAIGLVLRRKRPPEPFVQADPMVKRAEASVPLSPPSVSPSPSAPPQTYLSADASKPHFSQTSPDGSIRIDIEPVEWASSQFIHTPRVIEAASGRVLCDLLGSDWEAHASFPRDRYVWLGLRRFRSPGHLFVEFDLDADRYRIALSTLDAPDEEGPLGDISTRLDHWWQQATAIAAARADKETPAPASAPGPFAAWRTALALLIGALAAIAGLTYLSMTYGVEPPKIPIIRHVPSMPR